MKKTVLTFGLISGLIVSVFMIIGSSIMGYKDANYDLSMLIGYASMIVAFAFVYVGIRNFRDKFQNGAITFGKAFTIGALITLISSSMYVATWLVEYYCFIPDFMDKYTEHLMEQAKQSGSADLEQQVMQMQGYKEMYKNPLLVILLTYMEVLPVGLVISLISALILKKKVATPLI